MAGSDHPNLDDNLKRLAHEVNAKVMARLSVPLQEMFEADGYPDKLCHYTDFAGLKGILESNAFWATSTRTLNDGSEEKYGTKVVTDYVETLLHDTVAARQLEAMNVSSPRNFAVCFCENSSLLSMWRGYAGQGGGYCLEFGADLLGCSFPPFRDKNPLKITYGDTLPQTVQSVLDATCHFAREGNLEAVYAANWAKLMALKVKHPAFSEESEWRIVIRDPPVSELRFRSGSADIKPYLELRPVRKDGSKRLPLKRVVFGPTLRHDDSLIDAIGLMLERYGYDRVSVEPSGVPYRL